MTLIALAQINPTLGDLNGNAQKIRKAFANATASKANVVVFPKGALSGMPLQGLVENKDFIANGQAILKALASEFHHRAFFDECFLPITPPSVEPKLKVACQALPYYRNSLEAMWSEAGAKAKAAGVWIAECNLVGGQDSVVYPGGSFVADPEGNVRAAATFAEDIFLFELDLPVDKATPAKGDTIYWDETKLKQEIALSRTVSQTRLSYKGIAEVYRALVLAIHDYVDKSGLNGAAVSVSGGIDSAVVAALTVDALGPDRVKFITMPSPFTSHDTLADAKLLAENLNVHIEEVSIVESYYTARAALTNVFAEGLDDPEDISGQNLQARIRGMYVMALANRNNLLAMNCSNKTELMVGYGTMYGDLCGGFSPLKDVWKTDVWELARHANTVAEKPVIPTSIIDRVPSAELRENQEDRQSLPDYPVLDAILDKYIDQKQPYSTLIQEKFRLQDIQKAIGLNYTSAFKRQQAPLGPDLTRQDESELPMPVMNRYRPWLY